MSTTNLLNTLLGSCCDMTDYANMERTYQSPAIVRTTEELGIKTTSERLQECLDQLRARRDYREKEINVYKKTEQNESKKPKNISKMFYAPFTDEYIAIFKGDNFSARGIFDTNSNKYVFRTDIGPNPTFYFKLLPKGYDYGLSLRLGDDNYALEIEPSLLDGHFGFGLKTPIGYFGPFRLDSDKAVRKTIKGAKRTLIDYAILGDSKSSIPGKAGPIIEHVIVKNIVEGVIGKTPYGIGVTLLKRLFRGIHFKKADPRHTSSAWTTTDEYRNYRGNTRK